MKVLLAMTGTLAAVLVGLGVLAALLGVSQPASACSLAGTTANPTVGSGSWRATTYGPPWEGIQGTGVTATGQDLTAGQPAYEIAVDPRLIPLGSYVYVLPNPFGTHQAFYAGDTGGAITGNHIDIYDWRGRASQNAWGNRPVTVTPAPTPLHLPKNTALPEQESGTAVCGSTPLHGSTVLTAGPTAHILADGSAAAPAEAPAAVKLAIAAGNVIHTYPYPDPDVHYGTLTKLWPAYDCSGATSFVLYAAGLMSANPLDSTGLESYGQPGPGRWITIYANPTHAWIVIAGIAFDTAGYGGPAKPAGSGPRWRAEPVANLNDGMSYVARHPSGL